MSCHSDETLKQMFIQNKINKLNSKIEHTKIFKTLLQRTVQSLGIKDGKLDACLTEAINNDRNYITIMRPTGEILNALKTTIMMDRLLLRILAHVPTGSWLALTSETDPKDDKQEIHRLVLFMFSPAETPTNQKLVRCVRVNIINTPEICENRSSQSRKRVHFNRTGSVLGKQPSSNLHGSARKRYKHNPYDSFCN